MNQGLSHVSLRVLIAFAWLPVALTMGQIDAAPEAVVGRLVEAARKGNAAGIKLQLAPGSAGSQTTINRWADELAKAGPTLPADQLVDPQQSLIAGDFAVVRGGPPPGKVTRLRKINNQWKVLIPGDAGATYGLDRMIALNLSSLEKRAEREWKDAPAPTAASQNGSTATPGAAPDNTAPTDNADPVRHPNNPAIARVLPEFVALIPEIGKLQMPSSIVDKVIEALLDAGEVSAAEQVFRAAPRKDLIHAGELAVRSPGGVNGPAGREILALARASMDQFGTVKGIVFGLARMEQHSAAVAAVPRSEKGLGRQLFELRPHRAYRHFAPPVDPSDKTPYSTSTLWALYVVGDDQLAMEASNQHVKARTQPDPRGARDAELVVSVTRFFAMLYRGDLERAASFPDEYYKAATAPMEIERTPAQLQTVEGLARGVQTRAQHALICAHALRGQMDKVEALIEQLPPHLGGNFDPRLFAANGYARHADEAAISRLLAELNARKTKADIEHAVLFGLAVHGAHAAGHEALVSQYAEQFLKHLEGAQAVSRIRQLDAFLRCAARGPSVAIHIHFLSLHSFSLD